jgi:hypothetical protein
METPSPSMKRPFYVTILLVVVLIFTLLNGLRLVAAILDWRTLADLPMRVPVLYFILTGAFWAVTGFFLAVGLFLQRRWSAWLAWVALILYPLYYWIDRLFLAYRSAIANRTGFLVATTLLLSAFTLWTLSRPKTRSYLAK